MIVAIKPWSLSSRLVGQTQKINELLLWYHLLAQPNSRGEGWLGFLAFLKVVTTNNKLLVRTINIICATEFIREANSNNQALFLLNNFVIDHKIFT